MSSMNSITLSPFEQIENPRHSTKKESRSTSSNKKQLPRPPKIHYKRSNIKLLFSFPIPLLQNSNRFLSKLYDDKMNISYFEQLFESIKKIGEGSYGEVYKVKFKEDGKFYAVKILKEELGGECHREQKLAEVKNHSRIPYHKNCISLFNAWEQDEQIYLQMELGSLSLDQYAEHNHHVPENIVWNILLDMLLALKNLHDSNLIHLDVKLQNIIVFDGDCCKLGDFGLMLDLKGDWRYATEGDAKYLAPEVMHGKYTKAADIFSLGISMLELAADLELPANGKLWHDLRDGILPEWLNKNLSKEFLNFIKRMMLKDYKKRPSIKCLLKHPRMKSLLKQRRETPTDNRFLLETHFMFDSAYSSFLENPLNESESNNPRMTLTMATPPLGYSTPDMSVIFTDLDGSNKKNNQSLMNVPFLTNTLDEFCSSFCSTQDSDSDFSEKNVISSAKKLNFV